MKPGAIRPTLGRVLDRRAKARRLQGGQSLTELALIMPVVLLLTVVALDFGRVYLGYVNVENMARIAANYAANNPLAWGVTPDAAIQLRYRNQILEDATATNCQLPVSGGVPSVPAPAFSDVNLDGIATGLGDTVRVQINCSFLVATPLVSGILGGIVRVSAESNFPIQAGMTAVVPAGGGGGGGGGAIMAPPSAAFVANSSVFSGSPATTIAVTGPDVVVDLRDSSGGGPASSFHWQFGDGVESAAQDVAHAFHCASAVCTFMVSMEASNAYGTSTAHMTVVVIGDAEVNFVADRQVINRGQTVTFTDMSTDGGALFEWTFGDGGTASVTTDTVTHPYASVGTYDVTLRVTYPAPIGALPPLTKLAFITVNPGYCTVPSLTNVKFNNADGIWRGTPYGFTGHVRRATGAPNGNFNITAQSIAAGNGATAVCTSDVFVSAP